MKRILLACAQLAILCAPFFAIAASAEPYTSVNVHGALYDPTTETVGGWNVLTSQIGSEEQPKVAQDIGLTSREISAWTIASADQGRLDFQISSSITVHEEAPSGALSAFIQSTNNRVIDQIRINPGEGPEGPLNEGDTAQVLVQLRLDAVVQAQGRPSGAIHMVFRVRAASGTVNLPVIAEYDTGSLNPPQAFEVHEEWDIPVDVTVGEVLSYDATTSGWVLGTAFDPGMSGTNFIFIDSIMRVSNMPGYDLELISAAGAPTTALPMSNQFADVLPWHWAYTFIETLADSGITAGCGNANYCPANPVTRAQMAVFLERGINGSDYIPPPATGNVFIDVGTGDFAAAWIEQLFDDGITAGCGNNKYCPNAVVTRAQMAVFLLRAKYGSGHSPPPATGIFDDVPLSHWAVHWIEELAAEGITSGCGEDIYCPDAEVTRDQMAVFLVRTFGL